MENWEFPTLRSPTTSWCWSCHKVMKVGRSWILSMGPVSFAPTMVCSVAMVYFTMAAWLFQCCVGNFLSTPILESPVSIQRISQFYGGGYTLSMSGFQRLATCRDNIRRSQCLSLWSAVITADLEVLEFFFQNQQMLVKTLFINLWDEGSVY